MMENNTLDQPIKMSRPWYRRWWGIVAMVLAVVFVLVAALSALYFGRLWYLINTGVIDPKVFNTSQPLAAGNQLNTLATADDPAKGAANPSIVIVEFSDFQCPYCKQLTPVLDQVVKEYGQYVRVIYRDFPLAADHPDAVLAALAGQCAHEQGKFWPMHDMMFAHQDALNETTFKTYAVQIGMDSVQFGSCLQSQKYLNEIQQDYDDGWTAGVRATPTLFIQGQKVEGVVSYNDLQKFIVSYLNNR